MQAGFFHSILLTQTNGTNVIARAVLSWDYAVSDLDFHSREVYIEDGCFDSDNTSLLFCPDCHVFFANKECDYSCLDLDRTTPTVRLSVVDTAYFNRNMVFCLRTLI